MRGRTAILLSVALAGCGDRAAECADRVALFDARLAIAEEVRALPPPPGLNVPRADAPTRRDTRGLPILEVRPSALRLDGREVDEDGLREDLATMRRHWSLLHPDVGYEAAVVVWADADVPMSRLERLAVGPLADHDVLVMAQARAHPRAGELPACPESIGASCRTLETASPSERADVIAGIHTRAVGTCTPATRAFQATVGVPLREHASALRRGLVAAARECGCEGMDLDAIEYGILAGEDALAPPVGAFALRAPLPAEEGSMTVQRWVETRPNRS